MSEVGVTQLRQGLKQWLTRVQAGDEVIVTDHGRPVARLTRIDTPTALEQLIAQGHVSQAGQPRPFARGVRRVPAADAVSTLVVEERDRRRT
jgi:prevent-host-death family protein